MESREFKEVVVTIDDLLLGDLHIRPTHVEGRIKRLVDMIRDEVVPLAPKVTVENNVFYVVQGWDVVLAYKALGESEVRCKISSFSPHECIYFGVIEQAEAAGLHWVDVACHLLDVKKGLRWPDLEIAKALGWSRSRLTRTLGVIKKLNSDLLMLARQNVIGYRVARELSRADTQSQWNATTYLRAGGRDPNETLRAAGVGPQAKRSPQMDSVEPPPKEEKSMDVKRLEVKISEIIGQPFALNSAGATSELDVQFFSGDEASSALTVLAKFLQNAPSSSGRIRLSFDDTSGMDEVIMAIIDED